MILLILARGSSMLGMPLAAQSIVDTQYVGSAKSNRLKQQEDYVFSIL